MTDATTAFEEGHSPRNRGGAAAAEVSRIDLERAIALLPDGYRAAFVLHDVEGLQHRKVAAQLGVSDGTSKSQVHKARLRLRELLTGTLTGPRRVHASNQAGTTARALNLEPGT